jgi:malonyl-CoA O-methyltransferase
MHTSAVSPPQHAADAWLDRAAARRWFERAAAGADDPLAREVERRMASRLELVRNEPARILDVGGGAGAGVEALRARYPRADIVIADFAAAPLGRSRAAPSLRARLRSVLGGARAHPVCADMDALPLAAGSCGMVWSNLALAWSPAPAATLVEWHRVLAVGGLLMFSTYGPDTLRELRAAAALADDSPHVHPFVDMHDLGDALAAGGFADPVMDADRLTVTYARPEELVRDLRASGQRNAHVRRRRTLTGRARWRRIRAAWAPDPRDGRWPATFEIVYGHAWKAAPRKLADGRAIIRVERSAGARKAD